MEIHQIACPACEKPIKIRYHNSRPVTSPTKCPHCKAAIDLMVESTEDRCVFYFKNRERVSKTITQLQAWKYLLDEWSKEIPGSYYTHAYSHLCYSGLCHSIYMLSDRGLISDGVQKLMFAALERHRPESIGSRSEYFWPVEDTESRVEFCRRMVIILGVKRKGGKSETTRPAAPDQV